MNRIQYYNIIRKYEEQVENRDISIQYLNIGTIFEEKEFEESRRVLLLWLIEKQRQLSEKYAMIGAEEKTLSEPQKRLQGNVEKLLNRMETLQCKLQQKKMLVREDYVHTFFGLWEMFWYRIKV